MEESIAQQGLLELEAIEIWLQPHQNTGIIYPNIVYASEQQQWPHNGCKSFSFLELCVRLRFSFTQGSFSRRMNTRVVVRFHICIVPQALGAVV